MRIATSELYNASLSQMENQETQLVSLTSEISSGNALTNPGANPVAAAQAVQLSATSATLTQYASNQNTALASLQTEDSALSNVTTTMQSIESLIQEAMSGGLNDTNRAAVAQQMEGYRNQLMSLANTTDGEGNSIFSGFQNVAQVFSNNPGGGVTYNGDAGQRTVQVSDSRNIPIGDSGASVFMSVQALGSQPVPSGNAANTGTGTIGAVTVTDPTAATNNDNYTIAFVQDPNVTGQLDYTVTDNNAVPPTPTSPVAYTAGASIPLGSGLATSISGTPAVGDSFNVTPATSSANTDVFASLDSMIAALKNPADNNATALATMNNALSTGLAQVGNSLSNVTTIQASVGGREQELQALQSVTSSSSLQISTNLTNLTSVDLASSMSQFTEVQNALTASQKVFTQTQSLSLFQYYNP